MSKIRFSFLVLCLFTSMIFSACAPNVVITPDLAAVSVVYILVAAAAIWLLDKLVGLDIFLRSK